MILQTIQSYIAKKTQHFDPKKAALTRPGVGWTKKRLSIKSMKYHSGGIRSNLVMAS